MGKSIYQLTALGVLATLLLAGCPWSSSPTLFDGAKGVSLPTFGGPPPQTEPPLLDEDIANETQRADQDPF